MVWSVPIYWPIECVFATLDGRLGALSPCWQVYYDMYKPGFYL